ncbi:4'-phosphopantetheinyl transferase superfamily protein [Candidatus Bipolaricaulota bacterium]|nr:4'-phosphopantetheinyl transferase superfamily protein [Candidatus Bipolaricaulota bacterium]
MFLIPLDVPGEVVRGYASHLSDGEAARVARYRRHLDRRRYTIARGALRVLLSEITGNKPGDVPLSRTANGKPRLNPLDGQPQGVADLHFNLSHSGNWAIVAAARRARVGVDIERIDADTQVEALAKRFFSRGEAASVEALPADQRTSHFFSIWTSKEAYVKARGEKIANRLRTFTVSGGDEAAPGLLADTLDPAAAKRWRIVSLKAPRGYAASLAVEEIDPRIRVILWHHPQV